MSLKQYVTILTTGDEVLSGIVQDTNTSWLCSEVTKLGGNVKRAILCPDDKNTISREIKDFLLNTGSNILLVTGGLGPTIDDITLSSIASALDRNMIMDPDAVNFVNSRLEKLYNQGRTAYPVADDISLRMAIIPENSVIIKQSTGSAPGVLIEVGEKKIIAMPGVPEEMYDMFTNYVVPILKQEWGNKRYLETILTTNAKGENQTANILDEFNENNPDIYVKSRKGYLSNDDKKENKYVTVTLATHSSTKSSLDIEVKKIKDMLLGEEIIIQEEENNY